MSDFAIEMFDVLDAINYQSYNDFVLRVGEWEDIAQTHVGLNKQCVCVCVLGERGGLTYCTGHHSHSVPVSLGGNASQKVLHYLQEARHSET